MSSTGTRKERNVQTRSNEAITEADKEFINSLKIFSESSNSVAGLAGPAVNNSPKTPAGNYVAREGDSMIGPLALGPPLNFRVEVDANNTIDIGPLGENVQYSSNIQLDDIQPNSSTLDIIANAGFDGQILVMRTFAPTVPYDIRQATMANGGNIQTADGDDIVLSDLQMMILVFDESLIVFNNTGGTWRILSTSGGGGTGTFVSADLSADQTTNIAVANHIEFDRNATPTGADGGIVLQTGAGQADGIFELLDGKTYMLSGTARPLFSATNAVELVWYDITNATEIGRRCTFDDVVLGMNQPKCEIIYTAVGNVTVELRIVTVTTPGNLTGFDADFSFAHIFEFSGVNQGGGAATSTSSWKNPCRAGATIPLTLSNQFENGDVIDGITLVTGDRILIKDQAVATENGIYTVNASGAPTRATDFDVNDEIVASVMVMIEEGTTQKNTMWQLITNNPITVGVTNQVWDEFKSGEDFDIPGTGKDGKDGTGTFVLDGRMFSAINNMKIIQQNYDNIGPTFSMSDLLYIPADASVFNNEQLAGNLIVSGRMDQIPTTTNGAISSDYGETWSAVQINSTGTIPGTFAYDPVGDIAVCISGSTSSDAQRIRRSTDKGLTWGSTAYAGGVELIDVIWSARLSLFVAIALNTTTNAIYTSPDGNTWTNRTTAAGNPDPPAVSVFWKKLDDAPGLGKLVVVANASLDILTSTDGITWILEAMGDVAGGTSFTFVQTPQQLIWSEGQQQFLCKPTTGSMDTEGLFLSPDGINWTQHFLPNMSVAASHGVKQFRWMAEYSIWIGIGLGPINHQLFWLSTNGKDWTNAPSLNFRRKRVDVTKTDTFNVGTPRALAYAPEFGYVFGIGNLQETTGTADFDGNRFWRTEVYFQGKLDFTSA